MYPSSTARGSIGEHFVQACLCEIAQISKLEVDSGIDLYAKRIQKQIPNIPFSIEVKTRSKLGKAIEVEKKKLIYHLSKPYPVFIFAMDLKDVSQVYFYSIEKEREAVNSLVKGKSSKPRLQIDRHNSVSIGHTEKFEKALGESVELSHLRNGTPKFRGRGYVRQAPLAPKNDQQLNAVRSNLRTSLRSLGKYYQDHQDFENAKSCYEMIAVWDSIHYDHFRLIGEMELNIVEQTGVFDINRVQNALNAYIESLNICEKDEKWPRESIENIKNTLRTRIDFCSKLIERNS